MFSGDKTKTKDSTAKSEGDAISEKVDKAAAAKAKASEDAADAKKGGAIKTDNLLISKLKVSTTSAVTDKTFSDIDLIGNMAIQNLLATVQNCRGRMITGSGNQMEAFLAHWTSYCEINNVSDAKKMSLMRMVIGMCIAAVLGPFSVNAMGNTKQGDKIQGFYAEAFRLLPGLDKKTHAKVIQVREANKWGPYAATNVSLTRFIAYLFIEKNPSSLLSKEFLKRYEDVPTKVTESAKYFKRVSARTSSDEFTRISMESFQKFAQDVTTFEPNGVFERFLGDTFKSMIDAEGDQALREIKKVKDDATSLKKKEDLEKNKKK